MNAVMSEFESFLTGIAGSIAQHVAATPEPMIEVVAEPVAEAVPVAFVAPAHPFVLDHEKIVWHVPDIAARLIDD